MRLSSALLIFTLIPLATLAQEEGEVGADQPAQAPQANTMATTMPTREDGRIQSDFTAKLRILNRKQEKSTDISIPANQTKRYEDLAITALTCIQDAQGVRDNDMVFLRIEDEGRGVFNGWMSQQFPGVSLLQHPHYSVVVLGCS